MIGYGARRYVTIWRKIKTRGEWELGGGELKKKKGKNGK